MDIFSTAVLTRVIEDLVKPSKWFLTRYFPLLLTTAKQEIKFDTIKGGLKLAPYVIPEVAGQIRRSNGYITNTFTPAYVKPKRKFDPERAFKRLAGEKIGGVLSPAQRRKAALKTTLSDMVDELFRTLEYQACQIARTGQVIIEGANYPRRVVDFRRDPALTVAVESGAKWTVDGSKPLDDLTDWAQLILRKGHVSAIDVVMSPDVWKVFRSHPQVTERLDLKKAEQETFSLDGAAPAFGGHLKGSIDGFNIWVYQDIYEDEAGNEHTFFPDGTVCLLSSAIEGVQCFGGIKDEEALEQGRIETQFYCKSWVEKDPSCRFILGQSAPIVVPFRPNASLCATGVI